MAALPPANELRLREDAARWFLRLSHSPDDDALRTRFESWLMAAPAHAHAYSEVAATWEEFDDAERLRTLAAARDSAATRQRQRRRGALKQSAAAVLALGSVGVLWRVSRGPHTGTRLRLATAHGETRDVILSDGSRIQMGPATTLTYLFSDEQRSVAMLEGSAAFDVRHEPQRPFLVDMGGLEVKVLGTYFAIDILAERTRVGVQRGKVQVARPRRVFGWRLGNDADWLVTAGQVLDVTATGADRPAIPAADVFSLQGKVLTFTGTPLTEVAAILSRYRDRPILADPALRAVRIAAVVRTVDIEKFLLTLPRIAAVSVVDAGSDQATYLKKM
ncbi:FecR domain-containing protein [Bordetella sp. N]|uniref:FecR family protein n=1 Tax=Bordetella sp. N TaxID=1746199 RepID=UPI00070B3BC0|nr:FecR domain-containing protein [Bordetella sp. N]ALM84377.1 hypothetical protein ASB57_16620 [Bordetella sp. N]